MSDNFIDFIDNIIELRKSQKSASAEIAMWRKRFLKTVPPHEDEQLDADIYFSFISISSDDMITKKPEDHIKNLEEYFKSLKGKPYEN